MFDQTFIDAPGTAKKPAAVALSLTLQLCIVCLLVLIPLFYTQALPGVLLKSLIVAPITPRPVLSASSTPASQPRFTPRVLNPFTFVAPAARPKVSNFTTNPSAAPDLNTGLNSGDANAVDLPAGVIGARPDATAPAPAEHVPTSKPPAGPIRIGGTVAEANLIHKVVPPYPQLAKSTRVQGAVEFRAVISKEGNIEDLQLIHGHPLLVKSAKEAVLQWKYRPTLLNGAPVEVITDILVNFTLSQ